MSKIKLTSLSAQYDCEDCGTTFCEGYLVEIDGVEVLRFEPIAYCYDSAHYEIDFVYTQTLQHLGHTVEVGD